RRNCAISFCGTKHPGIAVYEGVDFLDVAVPCEMFKWVDKNKGLKSVVRSEDGCPVATHNALRFEPHSSFAEVETLDVS
ncbi:MAG: hypothetical protein ACR2PF_12965, partial [Rhizobiaceae bacterium]